MREDFFKSKWGIMSILMVLLIVLIIFFFIPVEPVTLVTGIDYYNPETYLNIFIIFLFIVVIPMIILYSCYLINKKIR